VADTADDEEVSQDTLLRGRITLLQPARGFRSSLDPVLLAGFVEPPFGRFLDIGCGTGALAFLLLTRDPGASGVGVEVQPRLARLATRSSEANGFGLRFTVEARDVRQLPLQAAGFDLVVTNPPFQPMGQGLLPPDEERAIAHHEVKLRLTDWLDVAARVLRPDGRLAVIYPPARLPELLAALNARALAPSRFRPVYPRAGEPATRVLVEARRQVARPLLLLPPLLVHEAGAYSLEVRQMLGED
jgi:tRNA1(Val) A37 N6-methylase TrmN6